MSFYICVIETLGVILNYCCDFWMTSLMQPAVFCLFWAVLAPKTDRFCHHILPFGTSTKLAGDEKKVFITTLFPSAPWGPPSQVHSYATPHKSILRENKIRPDFNLRINFFRHERETLCIVISEQLPTKVTTTNLLIFTLKHRHELCEIVWPTFTFVVVFI